MDRGDWEISLSCQGGHPYHGRRGEKGYRRTRMPFWDEPKDNDIYIEECKVYNREGDLIKVISAVTHGEIKAAKEAKSAR